MAQYSSLPTKMCCYISWSRSLWKIAAASAIHPAEKAIAFEHLIASGGILVPAELASSVNLRYFVRYFAVGRHLYLDVTQVKVGHEKRRLLFVYQRLAATGHRNNTP